MKPETYIGNFDIDVVGDTPILKVFNGQATFTLRWEGKGPAIELADHDDKGYLQEICVSEVEAVHFIGETQYTLQSARTYSTELSVTNSVSDWVETFITRYDIEHYKEFILIATRCKRLFFMNYLGQLDEIELNGVRTGEACPTYKRIDIFNGK